MTGSYKGLVCIALAALCFGSAGRSAAQCTAQAGPATATTCAGVALGLLGSGTGEAPLIFSWSGSPYLTSTSSAATSLNVPVPVAAAMVINLTLTVTDDAGCVATDVIAVTVQPTPRAALATSDGNPDLFVGPGGSTFALCGTGLSSYAFQFDDAGTARPGSTYTVAWGTPPSPFSPPSGGWSQAHTYPIGLHTITYTIADPSGCSHTTTAEVFLGSNPSVGTSNPGNTVVCSGTDITFPLNNTAGNSPGTEYVIAYGDGNVTSFMHPPPASVTYNYPNTNCPGAPYIFRVDAITPCPITSFATAGPIYITDTPQASFTMSSDTACANSPISFTNTSLGVGGANCAQPLRVWTITPATGWTASGLGALNGSNLPNQWTNGSNTISVQFTQPGSYCIMLTVGNTLCGIDDVQQCVCIEAPPQPAFTLTEDDGCAPFISTVDNTSTSPNSCRTVYAWNVGTSGGSCGSGPAWNYAGGTSAASVEPQFQFTQAGTYSITLEATNSCGTFDQVAVVNANAPPQVEVADLAGICATQCVDPSAVVQDCGSPVQSYSWSFTGGTPAVSNTLDPPQVCYAAPANSTISLTVTNACGSATDVTTLGVGSLPAQPVIASNSPVCAGQILTLSASSTPGVSFSWSGPNGFSSNTSSVTIPGVSAASAGVYSVVAVSNGCSSPAATVNVQVVSPPIITVIPSGAAICTGGTATLSASGAGNYQWFIGANLVGTGGVFNASPANTTSYTVSGDLGGCPGSNTVMVTVYPVTNVDAGSDQVFCDQPIPVNLAAFPSPGTWSGTNVTPAGVFTPVPGQLGVVDLTYTHTDANGCTNTDQVSITVEDLVQVADAGVDTFFCQGPDPVLLPASPAGGTWVGAGPGGLFTPVTVGAFMVTYTYGTGTCATNDQLEVQVLPSPAITLPPDIVRCADDAPVELGGTPGGGTWSGVGVSGPPFTFDPSAAPDGPHVLTYSYTDASGCSSSGQLNATVNALPVVDAGPDVQLCDQPIPFPLAAMPAGGTWSAASFNVTPAGVITPGGVGSDVLTYSFTDAAGCSGQDQVDVEVIAIDEPADAGNDTAICVLSGPLLLTASPAGGSWSGPQVSSTGEFDASVPGSYTLTYSTGTATCLLQDQVVVTVHPLPMVDAGDAIATCLDGGVQLLAAFPAGGTWSGNGVDALGNFDPLLALPGGNPLTYSFADPSTGCLNTDNTLVTVEPLPIAGFTHDPVACVNVAFPFTNTSTGASTYVWDFGDGSASPSAQPFHAYAAPGTYVVRLVAITDAGCRDTILSTLVVWDIPQAAIVLSTDTGCGPLEVAFTNNTTGDGLQYAWDFGGLDGSTDQTPGPFTFPPDPQAAITYVVTLTATNTCGQDESSGQVTVIPTPTAAFGPNLNAYCAFAEVPFGNASFGEPTAFEWIFGDGAVSTDPGPVVTHAYAAADDALDFTVTLIATNGCGSDSAFREITILPNEVNAFFNADPVEGCSPLTVNLAQFSAGDTAYYWDLGDGEVSDQHDLSHTYTAPGTYTITLYAYGCGFDQFSTDVTVFPAPETAFSFTPASACVGSSFDFTNLTPNVSSLSWDLGDGTTSTSSTPTHTYASSGTYSVTLTAELIGTACTASSTRQVQVLATPTAVIAADPGSGCIDLQVAFTNNSTNADFHAWDFGDGNTSALVEPFHTYAAAGSYTVRLITSALSGCTDTTTTTVVAHPLPDAAFSLSITESCGPTSNVQTVNASQGAVGYEWDLGNGTLSLLNQPEAFYTGAGAYTIALVAINSFGCTDTARAVFIQHPTPQASFTAEPQPGCVGYPVDFVNSSVNASSFEWLLGDGTTTSVSHPIHAYASAGIYDVRLIAMGEGGCTDTLVADAALIIHPRPSASYTMDTLQSLSNALQFRNLSEGAITFEWDLGDGETSTAVNPLHVFPADGGGFLVCLVGVNDFGCPDTTCRMITLPGDPDVFAPNSFTPNGDALNDGFRPILNGFVGWNYRLIVFDRWGLKAFETMDPAAEWEGERNGILSPVDVYIWKLVVERDGDARTFVGHVTLVR